MKNVRIVRSLTNTRYRSVPTAAFSHCAAGFAAHSTLHQRDSTQADEHGRFFQIKIEEKLMHWMKSWFRSLIHLQ